MTLRIGIDTGGTFTDLVVADGERVYAAVKSLTTHGDLPSGTLKALDKAGVAGGEVERIVHGTTVALNAILTRRGAEVGLVTTMGYRDLLDMGRGWRPWEDALIDPRWRRPHELRPIIERHRRRTVPERVRADGGTVVALDEAHLLAEVEKLVADGCESIAICFLHSYKHPGHEQRAAELVRERFPQLSVSTSADVAPFPREYSRFCTCVLNAYAQPLMDTYTSDLEERLQRSGYSAPLMFMTNDGGLIGPEQATARPVTTLNSGPVGGVMGAEMYARRLGIPNLVGFDMGGTSTDVAVVADGRASAERELVLEHDVIAGIPVLEIHSIGAGGGSIASLDAAGGLNVGPESAGSNPGPACYGRGGTLPTVTDAFLLLGMLDPKVALGGEIPPDVDAAEQAYAGLGDQLGAAPGDLAKAVTEVAIHNMAEAVRQLTVYRGADPRDFGLLAYGAAGPLVATQVARSLQMPRVVIPALAGVFSAFGLLGAKVFEEDVTPVMAVATEELAAEVFARLRQTGARLAEASGHPDIHLEFRLDGMYAGQRSELEALVNPAHEQPLGHLREVFGEAHRRQFGYTLPADVYISTVRVRAVEPAAREVLPPELEAREEGRPRSARDIVIGGERHEGVPVYEAAALAPGQRITGPAVVEAASYSAVIGDGDVAEINSVGDILIDIREAV
ncbi:hydantoinase/oxoprolinase family protein [Amycolatopsis pithecellobii]|uniref:Hydantoinase/oxoprolinase family protein n=1 Tax=Amycolatopsis pithecellobii TaxID=664692 RepID=A0A6N7Z3A5_9PSEU|nr:hydantoinase/oxoprolinase family protein [Amycolatopsis pithecellobii]MTD55559.1 hydantoinase/oxoprolinase family protein [Amycolatopsis pithecellobii]